MCEVPKDSRTQDSDLLFDQIQSSKRTLLNICHKYLHIIIPHQASSSLPIPWQADLPSQLSHGETSSPLQGSLPAQNVLYYHDVDHNNADDADDDDDNVDDVGDDNLYRWLWLLGNREPGKSILTTLLIMMMVVMEGPPCSS